MVKRKILPCQESKTGKANNDDDNEDDHICKQKMGKQV
jgi:hypothetical protein